jgi:hypothetical protein
MKFKKGKSWNPRGRPKLCNLNIKDMAARDSIRAYKLLWQSVQKGEPWAIDIFFRYFILNDMVITEVLDHDQDPIFYETPNLS